MVQTSTTDPPVNRDQTPASEPASRFFPGGGDEPGQGSATEPASASFPGGGDEVQLSPEPGSQPEPASEALIDRASAAVLSREAIPEAQALSLFIVAQGGSWAGWETDILPVRDGALDLDGLDRAVACLLQLRLVDCRRREGWTEFSWRGPVGQAEPTTEQNTEQDTEHLFRPLFPSPPDPPTLSPLSIRKGLTQRLTPCGSPAGQPPAGANPSILGPFSRLAPSSGSVELGCNPSLSLELGGRAERQSLTNIKREDLELRISDQPLQENLPGISRAKPPELRRARKKSHPLYEQTRRLVVLWASRSGRNEAVEAERVTPFRMKLVRERLAEGYSWEDLARAVSGVAYNPWRRERGVDSFESALKAGRVDQAITEWTRYAPIEKVAEFAARYGQTPPARTEELEAYLAERRRAEQERRAWRTHQRETEELRARRELEAQAKAAEESWVADFCRDQAEEAEQWAAEKANEKSRGVTDDQ